MNNFSFPVSPSIPKETSQNSGPPKRGAKHYVTLKRSEVRSEENESLLYIERAMSGKPYMIHSQNTFPYVYENEANGIRRPGMVGWLYSVDYSAIGGIRIRDEFYIRFLPSPLYEIEMQREYDMRMMEEAKRMKVKELDAKKDVIAEEEKSRKVSRQLSDEEALRSFQKAKMMAEQNASMPPSIDSLELEPMVIPLTEEDKIPEERQKKDAKDAKAKEKEMQMLNSFLRNKERIKGMKSPSGPSAP